MNSCLTVLYYTYRWNAVSTGNTFQDLSRLGETADNTESCIQGVTGGTDQTSGKCFLC